MESDTDETEFLQKTPFFMTTNDDMATEIEGFVAWKVVNGKFSRFSVPEMKLTLLRFARRGEWSA